MKVTIKSIEILHNRIVFVLFTGDENVVTALIRNKADVNTKKKRGHTPLIVAAFTGDLKSSKIKLQLFSGSKDREHSHPK